MGTGRRIDGWGRDKGKNSRLRALPARLKFDRPIAYF